MLVLSCLAAAMLIYRRCVWGEAIRKDALANSDRNSVRVIERLLEDRGHHALNECVQDTLNTVQREGEKAEATRNNTST